MHNKEITEIFESKWKEIAKEEGEFCHDCVKIIMLAKPEDFSVIMECAMCAHNLFVETSKRVAEALKPHFTPDLKE